MVVVFMMWLAEGVGKAELIGHWMLDEANGTIASDSSGNGHHANLMGGLSFDSNSVPGMIGNALELDGRDDYIVAETVFIPTTSFTITLWFNPHSYLDTSSKRMDLVYWKGPVKPYGDKPYLTFNKTRDYQRSGKISLVANMCQTEECYISTLTDSWKASTWYHIAATFDGIDLKIYVNGVLENTMTCPGKHYASSQARFGIRTDGLYAFDGKLDDIRIYDQTLKADEIAQLGNLSPELQKLISDVSGIKETIKGLKAQEVINMLEKKIAECERWKEKNPNDVGLYYKIVFSDLYFLLAKAKEKAGFPDKEVIAAYERATSSFNKAGEAFAWLFDHLSAERYRGTAKTLVQNGRLEYRGISRQFQSSGNWVAFTSFLDVVFDGVEKPVDVAKCLGNDLYGGGIWREKYLEYCKSKTQLTEYSFEEDCQIAEKYIDSGDFKNAADVYRNIIKQCGAHQDKTGLEIKVCKCILDAGDYQNAISELDQFIDRNKSANKKVAKEAVLMKGQCYIQLGDPNKALDEFVKLVTEYPEARQTPEFGFYTAYCYMLQSKGDKATETFNFIIQNYPESSYANNARLCLSRMKNTAEKQK